MAYDYDLICIGSGPAGQRAAVQAAKLGKKVAVIEKKQTVGGVCVDTGTIPSKTFREAVLFYTSMSGRFDAQQAVRGGSRPAAADLLARVGETVATEQAVVERQLRRNDITDGYIRLVVTRGVGGLGIDPSSCRNPEVIVIARPILSFYREPSSGIKLVTSSLRRPSPDTLSPSIKSLNYVNNVLARMEANDHGADEGLLLDVNGYVAEATADNVFMIRSGAVITPTATDGILEGLESLKSESRTLTTERDGGGKWSKYWLSPSACQGHWSIRCFIRRIA
jgi:hypothetical protein